MTTVVNKLDEIREETINVHYLSATAELFDKLKVEPLRTKFTIYSGCVSAPIASEISHRLNTEGLACKVMTSGYVSRVYYLDVEVALPEAFIHPETIIETLELEPKETKETKDVVCDTKGEEPKDLKEQK